MQGGKPHPAYATLILRLSLQTLQLQEWAVGWNFDPGGNQVNSQASTRMKPLYE